jgi:hypothetical protein
MAIEFSQLENQDFVKIFMLFIILLKKIFDKKNLDIALPKFYFIFVDCLSNGPLIKAFIYPSIFFDDNRMITIRMFFQNYYTICLIICYKSLSFFCV